MARLRVMQLITELAPAGAERCVYELARRLDRSRFDVSVVGLRGGAMAGLLQEAGVPVHVLGVRGRWDLPKLVSLVRLLRAGRVDVLHTHLFHADLAGRVAAYLAGVPHAVHTVHTAEARFRPWQFAFARLWAGLGGTAAPGRRTAGIIAVSESVRDHHAARSGLPAGCYAVIPNGVDVDAFARDEEARAANRRAWGVGDGEFLLAFVGRLDREKGVDTLLAAMVLLDSRGLAPRLAMAGDGPERPMVEGFLAGAAGRGTRRLGFVDDVRGVLSAADALVMPSRWEGFGMAAAEAMAAGLPVIAANVPGLRDVVADGLTGLMVPPEEPEALAACIERLTDDAKLCRQLGRSGRNRVAEMFHIDMTVAAHAELYQSIAGPA